MKNSLLYLLPSFWILPLFTACSDPAAETTAPRVLEVEQVEEEWWHTAVIYEIWPRSFKDADGDGNGDFKGMTSKLDYLVDLGVNGIWLTPIFEAPSYHGYDFESFTEVEADYGTMEDFDRFLEEAHSRDIRIILDLVINHISNLHPWFVRSAAREPGFEDYFLWSKERPAEWGRAWGNEPDPESVWHWHEGRGEYYYGAFGPSQPDVNLRNPRVVEEMNQMAAFWLNKGVDGFRLDAVRYALEDMEPGSVDQADTAGTIAYWSQFGDFVKSVKPDALLVAEAWADMPTIGLYRANGDGLDSAFDFEFGYNIIYLLTGSEERVADFGTVGDSTRQTLGRDKLWVNLVNRQEHAPLGYYAPFLTNHDQVRLMHSLEQDMDRGRVAASLLMTTPGSLYLYYGEEIGITQDRVGDDTYKRAIMQWENSDTAGFNETGIRWIDDPQWTPWVSGFKPWWGNFWDSQRTSGVASVAEQMEDPESLWHHYRKLIQARASLPEIALPDRIEYYPVKNESVWLLRFLRGESAALVIVNLDSKEANSFKLPASLRGTYFDEYSDVPVSLEDSVVLNAGGVLLLRPR